MKTSRDKQTLMVAALARAKNKTSRDIQTLTMAALAKANKNKQGQADINGDSFSKGKRKQAGTYRH